MADKRELIYRLIGKETVSDATKDAGKALDKLGDDFKDAGKASDKLDKEIADTEKSLKSLAAQFANTGDDKFFKQIREGERDLRKLKKTSKLLGDDFGKDIAEGASIGFRQKFGALIAEGPGVAVAGATLGLAMAPTLSAALAGAVVGGAGVGGVIGGLVLASKDSRVQQAATVMGDEVKQGLSHGTEAFVQPAIKGILIVRKAFQDIQPVINGIFDDAAKYVEPLVTGATNGAKSIIVGIADAVHKARPVIGSLSRAFDQVGDAVGDTFTQMADDADGGSKAIDDLTYSITNLVKVSGDLLHLTANTRNYTDELQVAINKGRYWYEDLVNNSERFKTLGIQIDLTADGFKYGTKEAEAYRKAGIGTADATDYATLKLAGMTDAQIINADVSGKYREELEKAGIKTKDLANAHNDAANAAKNQATALQKLGTELQAQSDPMFNLIQKQGELKEAQKEYNKAVDEHGKKSPQAQEALRKMAQAAIALEIATGAAGDKFDGKLTPAMKATLRAAGFTKGEIADLEAQFKTAKAAGDKFAKNYKADVFVDWHYRTFGKPGTAINGIGGSTFKGRASGGPIKAGTPYWVGEEGPELITPTKDGFVHDAKKTAAMMRQSSGSSAGRAGGGSVNFYGDIVLPGVRDVDGLIRDLRARLRKKPNLLTAG